MYEARESAIDAYSAERRKAIKRIARQMRIEAGFSQQAVATFLGCSRARITSIEREESDTDYSQGELELLATLCGRHPLDIVRLAGQDTIALAEMMTAKLTGRALGRMIDCQLPKQLARLLLIEESPGSIVFSPTGHTMASIVDSDLVEYCEEDEAAEEAYQPTLLCWDTHSGKLLGQVCLPDTGEIVLLDEDRVAITTRASAWEDDGVDVNEERSSLLLWNARSGEIAHITQLPARVRNLAGSQGGEFLAAYMPTITAIQVWRTADWQPAIAYELGISEISGEPGGRLARASDCYDLPRQEKQSPHGLYFGADRFAFLDDHTLVVNFYKRVVELDIRSSSAGYAALLRNLKDFGVLPEIPISLTKKRYLEIEENVRRFSR